MTRFPTKPTSKKPNAAEMYEWVMARYPKIMARLHESELEDARKRK